MMKNLKTMLLGLLLTNLGSTGFIIGAIGNAAVVLGIGIAMLAIGILLFLAGFLRSDDSDK